MPIYEYRCSACNRLSSFLLLRVTEEIEPYCKNCGSKDVTKLISRVSIIRSEEKRIEGLLDPSKLSGLDESDPGSIEKFMRKMGGELGDELGQGFEESMEEAMGGGGFTPEEDL
jgi:putative FmdB family regulatory protein